MEPMAKQMPGKEQMPEGGLAMAEEKPATQPNDKATETYRRMVLAAMKVLYTKEVTAQLVELMRSGAENPAEGVAQAASTVLGILSEKVNGIDPKAVYAVTPPVVMLLMELAGVAKLFEPTPEILQQAIQMVGAQAGQAAPAQEQPQEQAPEQGRGIIQSQMQPGMMPAGA